MAKEKKPTPGLARARLVFVEVGGKSRPVRVEFNALCIVEELTGVNAMEGVASPTLRVLRALCFGALVSGCEATKRRVDFTLEDVGEWMREEPDLITVVAEMAKEAMGQDEEPPGPKEAEGEAVPQDPPIGLRPETTSENAAAL